MKNLASHTSKKQRLHYREQAREDGLFQETVGADLRAMRTERDLGIEDVAGELRLKAEDIRAIEESDFDALPGKTYAIGFVRAYARFMGAAPGTEAEEYVRRFKAEMTDAEELKFNSITRKDPRKRLPFGLMVTGAMTLIIAVMIWRMADRAVGAGEDVLDAFQPELPEVADLARIGADQMGGSGLAEAGLSFSPAGNDPVATGAIGPSDIPDGVLWGSENHTARIRIKALSDVWLRIEVDGRVMFERILKTGDSYSPSGRGKASIATRNASELEIYVDGRYIRRLGKEGEPFAAARLDPDTLLEDR